MPQRSAERRATRLARRDAGTIDRPSGFEAAASASPARDMINKGDHPELTHMYGAQHYYGYMIGNVAKFMLG